VLSLMTGAPIVVGAAVRRGDGPFLFRLALLDPAADRSLHVVEITTRINQILERWIREDLEQWRWIHWRWKARPDGTEETYTRADVRACFGETSPHGATGAGSEA
jgi:lauroyl/myristoyl acyltransferase